MGFSGWRSWQLPHQRRPLLPGAAVPASGALRACRKVHARRCRGDIASEIVGSRISKLVVQCSGTAPEARYEAPPSLLLVSLLAGRQL